MKICQNCGHENTDSGKFCEECGTKLVEAPKFCPECGIKLEGTPKFCPECGFSLLSGENNDEDYSTEYEDNSYETDDEVEDTYESEDEDYSYSEDDSESDDYEEYVDEDSYEDDESVEDRIVSLLDEYLPKICKGCTWYTKSGGTFDKPEYRTRIENARSKIVYNRSASEILGMLDITIFKNGKDGLVFLTDGISFDYGFSKVTVPYTQMGEMFLDKALHFQHWIENKNNSAWKGDVTIYGIYYNLSTLKDCLEEIYAII